MNYPINAIVVIGILTLIFGFEIFIVYRADKKERGIGE